MLRITLSAEPSAGAWGEKALLSYQEDGAVIHYRNDYPLRRIQQAARRLQSQGAAQVSLEGDGWSYERQWAFYCALPPP